MTTLEFYSFPASDEPATVQLFAHGTAMQLGHDLYTGSGGLVTRVNIRVVRYAPED